LPSVTSLLLGLSPLAMWWQLLLLPLLHNAIFLLLSMTVRQLLPKPLHRHTFSKAIAEVTAMLLPKLLHCHAGTKASTLSRWCQSCGIAMLLPKLQHCHAIAKAAALPCCTAMPLPPLSMCSSCNAVADMAHCYAVATALWALLLSITQPLLPALKCLWWPWVNCHLSFVIVVTVKYNDGMMDIASAFLWPSCRCHVSHLAARYLWFVLTACDLTLLLFCCKECLYSRGDHEMINMILSIVEHWVLSTLCTSKKKLDAIFHTINAYTPIDIFDGRSIHSSHNIFNQEYINFIGDYAGFGSNLGQVLTMEEPLAKKEVTHPLNYTPLLHAISRFWWHVPSACHCCNYAENHNPGLANCWQWYA